jgi:predicted phosphodiesterase
MNDVKTQVVNKRLNDGWSYSKIKEEFGVPKSTAQDWVKKYQEDEDAGCTIVNNSLNLFTNTNLQKGPKEKFKKTEDEVLSFLDQLAPIDVVRCKKIPPFVEYNDYVVVLSDMHFPVHCQLSIDVVLETIQQLQPKSIILNGDTCDMLSVSRFPKDIRHTYNLLDERTAYQAFLTDLIEVSNGAEIVETSANHSGGGHDGRWFRYLSERLGELACLPDIAEKLSYENVFLGDFQDVVKSADYVEVCKDLVVLHGDVVRKNGGYSARGMIDKYYQSIIMGHTHRIGMTAQRVPGIGTRKESQIFAWELGCLCDLHPIYASAPNWQNGFGIISTSDVDDTYGVEPVMIQNGVANVATLGCTIRA